MTKETFLQYFATFTQIAYFGKQKIDKKLECKMTKETFLQYFATFTQIAYFNFWFLEDFYN